MLPASKASVVVNDNLDNVPVIFLIPAHNDIDPPPLDKVPLIAQVLSAPVVETKLRVIVPFLVSEAEFPPTIKPLE